MTNMVRACSYADPSDPAGGEMALFFSRSLSFGRTATALRDRSGSFGGHALAADAAGWAQARGELPEIARLAARPRASGLVRHARRLHAQLTG